MSKIKFAFPNGFSAIATILVKEEPECSKKVWELLKNGAVKIACYNTVSTGGFFAGFPRPPKEPVSSGTQVDAIGNNNKCIYDLNPGEINWTGWNFWFTYSPCTEPVGIGGPVIAKIDTDCLDKYIEACNEVWLYQYKYHKLPIITVERGED